MKTGHFDLEDTGCIQNMRTSGGLNTQVPRILFSPKLLELNSINLMSYVSNPHVPRHIYNHMFSRPYISPL